MEHDLQKKQELELWNIVSREKPKQMEKTLTRFPQRTRWEAQNRNYRTISQPKKAVQASRRKKYERGECFFIG